MERKCWSWVEDIMDPHEEISDDEVQYAYKMHFTPHIPHIHPCKRNCKFNPK